MKVKRKTRSPGNTSKDSDHYPKGLNRKRVQTLINYYENQTDEEAIAEAESAYRSPKMTMMQIPNELVPKAQKLISKRAG